MPPDKEETKEKIQIDSRPSTSKPRTFQTKENCNRTQKRTNKTGFRPNIQSKHEIKSPADNKKNVKSKFKETYNVAEKAYQASKCLSHRDSLKPEDGFKSRKKTNQGQWAKNQNYLKDCQSYKSNQRIHQPTENAKQSGYSNECNDPHLGHIKKTNQPIKKFTSKKKNLLKSKIDTVKIIKELKVASKDESACDFEKMSEMLTNSNISVEYKVLLDFIDLVSKIAVEESSNKLEILQMVFQKPFLDAILKFMQNKTKELTKSDEGKEKCNSFFLKFLELSVLAIKLLPASSLIFLKHTLVFTKTILHRLEGRIIITHQHFDFQEMAIQIEEKAKQEELAREEVSPLDVEGMKNMSVLPTVEDLFELPPDLKKNIVEGAYKNVDHYLTVQFTLLHEDFIAPLREGISVFLSSSSNAVKRKTQVAIYHHVRITHASIDSGKFGHVVQLDRNIKWEIVTRFFIFGSLLLFTTDYFKSFFVATVIDVNKEKRTLTIKLNANYNKVCKNVYADEFVMAVSKVFFEPYYHVLRALQKMADEEFPMKKYIVEVSSEPQPPAYISQLNIDRYTIGEQTVVEILNPCWPQFTTLKFNLSQQRAFQAALTNEFVAIQGPPGTGKTFLGLQIVSALLDNVSTDSPILVVCYKNHALDQFLEGVLNKTKNIIRIGGRSKNENLKKFNLKDLRGSYGYHEHEAFLKTLATSYFRTKNQMDGLKKHGIVSVQNVLPYVVSPKFRAELMTTSFEDWLMEGVYIDEKWEVCNGEVCDVDEKQNEFIALSDEVFDKCNESNTKLENQIQVPSPNNDHDNSDCKSKDKEKGKFNAEMGQIEEYNTNDNLLNRNNHINDSEYSYVNESDDGQYQEGIVNNFDSPLSFLQEEQIGSQIHPIFGKEHDHSKSSVGFSNDNSCNYSQTCYQPSVEFDTYLETTSNEDNKNSTTHVPKEQMICFSEESKQRFVEMYINDYSNIYGEVADEVQEEVLNVMYECQDEGKTSSYSQILAPNFTLTINSLKELCWEHESRIQNLLKNENIDDDTKSFWQSVWEQGIDDLKKRISFLKRMLAMNVTFQSKKVKNIYEMGENFGIWALPNSERWILYHSWLDSFAEDIKGEMIKLEESICFGEQRLDEARSKADLEILQRAKIVGVTTSGAAMNRSTLNKLGASIVVIEEAAEVLESHIVTSLSSKCQHLILIGDHKQLRPNPAVYKLCKKYNFDVSLFERMVRNGLSCHALDVQHRMRPEFASLIVPSIYPNLVNHHSTENRPDIRGVHSNLYFISHDHSEEQLLETESHVNKFEAKFVLELANYLLLQGYSSDEITILATYSGQVKKIIKMRDQIIPTQKDLRISTVDDFQGEENKIIILSLVRSNEEGKIGFLKIENRVCVALSRAREGLYIIGNMDCLTENSQIWPQVKERLIEHNALGQTLSVYCQNHQETITLVRDGGMFREMPEGGCSKMCEVKLSCGHVCKYHCHPRDQQHTDLYKCNFPCERTCKAEHPCRRLCGEDCGPCLQLVEYDLACGHTMKAACSSDPAALKCRVTLPCVLACGHPSTKLCSETEEQVARRKCKSVCKKALQCGHSCTQTCGDIHICAKPLCKVEVEKVFECEHKTIVRCYERLKITLCYQQVEKTLACGHTHSAPCHVYKNPIFCIVEVKKILKCNHTTIVDCGESGEEVVCSEEVSRKLPCGHETWAQCGSPLASLVCQITCAKLLKCGHHCMEKCSSPCICTTVVEKELPCGHKVKAKCSSESTTCDQPCERDLDCGHRCKETCGKTCGVKKCQQLALSKVKPACGHGPVMAPCFYNNEPEVSAVKLVEFCKATCVAALRCGHICSGECSSCIANKAHALCNQPCRIVFPCGHRCPKKCHENCGVCNQRCLNRCSHKKCNRICGEPCDLCQEPCDRGCVHKRCRRPCFTVCDRRPCSLPCPSTLVCGHPCLGFCGERCPPLCLQCIPQHPLAAGRKVNSRLVILEDCGHIVDAIKMDVFFFRNKSRLLKCPVVSCQAPIITTKRYHKEVTEALSSIMKLKRHIIEGNKRNQFNTEGSRENSSFPSIQRGTTSCDPHGDSPRGRTYQSSQNGATSRIPYCNSPRGSRPYQSSRNGTASRIPHPRGSRPYQSSQNGATSRIIHCNRPRGRRPYQPSQMERLQDIPIAKSKM